MPEINFFNVAVLFTIIGVVALVIILVGINRKPKPLDRKGVLKPLQGKPIYEEPDNDVSVSLSIPDLDDPVPVEKPFESLPKSNDAVSIAESDTVADPRLRPRSRNDVNPATSGFQVDRPIVTRERHDPPPRGTYPISEKRRDLERTTYITLGLRCKEALREQLWVEIKKWKENRDTELDLESITRLNTPNVLNGLRDLFALCGEMVLLQQLLALKPELEDDAFRTKFKQLFEELSDEAHWSNAPQTETLWEGILETLGWK